MSFKMVPKFLAVAAPLLWGSVILLYAWRGQLQLFVYPLYIPLVVGAGVLLFVFGISEALQGRRRSLIATLALCGSAVLALLITPGPLSAAIAQDRGVTDQLPQMQTAPPVFRFALSTENMELLDWLRVLGGTANPQRFAGEKVHVTGMIVRDNERAHVVRLAIACCIADATPVGLPAQFAQEPPSAGSWVSVTGKLAFDASGSPFIDAAAWSPIPSPKDPYAYL